MHSQNCQNWNTKNWRYAPKGAFLTHSRQVAEAPYQFFFENLILKPAMGSCIKVVKQKKIGFLLKKKVSKRTIFQPPKEPLFVRKYVPFSVIDAFAKL
jgi:hypothetical protein